ncbi:DUF4184 family protein [Actinoplanes sp. TBRC 11911]|uniref:DUF4184 family protein n=1 Tax=Actinoplanes sp. TBRC 11911 TaxID=2729386 RepID=UPI00145D4DD6|nr:DUF4184 family protein [Actinoplanes sp. TBRC 11911]NMO52935.1 DUF4184 family protein [Actinoplanes sp. TBRC 11911]
MPLTVPTHPAAVLPLKLWRPGWFDGVALVLGSMVPDLGYAFDGVDLDLYHFAHSWPGLLGWSLPLTLIGAALIRRAAPAVAAHLPGAARDFAVLGTSRPAWWVTILSTLIGAASHLVLDDLEALSPVGEWAGHVAGFVSLPLLIATILRRRLLVRWHGPPPAPPPRSRTFWPLALAITVVGLASIPFLPGRFLVHTSGIRALTALGIGLLVASLLTTPGARILRR